MFSGFRSEVHFDIERFEREVLAFDGASELLESMDEDEVSALVDALLPEYLTFGPVNEHD